MAIFTPEERLGTEIHDKSDLTTSNILLRIAENVQCWSDHEVYINLSQPQTDEVVTCDDSPPGPHAPAELIDYLISTIHAGTLPFSKKISPYRLWAIFFESDYRRAF